MNNNNIDININLENKKFKKLKSLAVKNGYSDTKDYLKFIINELIKDEVDFYDIGKINHEDKKQLEQTLVELGYI